MTVLPLVLPFAGVKSVSDGGLKNRKDRFRISNPRAAEKFHAEPIGERKRRTSQREHGDSRTA